MTLQSTFHRIVSQTKPTLKLAIPVEMVLSRIDKALVVAPRLLPPHSTQFGNALDMAVVLPGLGELSINEI
jgi:hypothetical protein